MNSYANDTLITKWSYLQHGFCGFPETFGQCKMVQLEGEAILLMSIVSSVENPTLPIPLVDCE
jgi:hypothetical protein